ncbi:hypothetical protein [Endozoicomonas sp. ONNA1]|uniref:hypothetical protein n=1 Tax=Endozoicomonas sp. ONNA1 TaxID=2828740 RepID=UPI0021475159|nr:hypothetical protein [Endozoicomonas sp. ONNA1]
MPTFDELSTSLRDVIETRSQDPTTSAEDLLLLSKSLAELNTIRPKEGLVLFDQGVNLSDNILADGTEFPITITTTGVLPDNAKYAFVHIESFSEIPAAGSDGFFILAGPTAESVANKGYIVDITNINNSVDAANTAIPPVVINMYTGNYGAPSQQDPNVSIDNNHYFGYHNRVLIPLDSVTGEFVINADYLERVFQLRIITHCLGYYA